VVSESYTAKYTGIVQDNADDQKLGHLKVSVPAVFPPDEQVVARPALPFGHFFVPETEAKVWIEFEGGDPGLPLWTGVQYVAGEWAQEAEADPPEKRAIKTAAGHLILFNDKGGDEAIEIHEGKKGHVIKIDKDGIKVTEGAKGHEIAMDSNGVKVSQGGKPHSVTLADSGVTVDAGSDSLELKGMSIKLTANSGVTVAGGGGMVEVTGTLIKLGDGTAPATRSLDTGIGNMGGPVPLLPPGNTKVMI
jgi:Type VI secretion system/phage-baseplate injector OB domain